MKKTALLVASCFLALLAACHRMPKIPFDPAGAAVLNEEEDLMAHCSAFTFSKEAKTLYLAYYHDQEQTLEAPDKISICPVLAEFDFPSLALRKRVEPIHTGETVGNYTHSTRRAPYDPNLLSLGDTLFYYFVGCIDTTVTFCVRRYDTVSGQFENNIEPCRLRYDGKTVDFNTVNYFAMLEEKGLPYTWNNDLLISGAFVEHKGEWYCSTGTAFHKRSFPVVIKTSDGINFDVVLFCPEFLFGCCESSVAIWKDCYYVIERNSGVERGWRGIYLAKYSLDGACLVPPVYLTEAQAKPALVVHRGQLYAIYNANPFLYTDWGFVNRSRLRISRIGPDCQVLESRDITDPFGIHYPYVREQDGEVWISFTEDRKQLDPYQTRSNISFTKVEL